VKLRRKESIICFRDHVIAASLKRDGVDLVVRRRRRDHPGDGRGADRARASRGPRAHPFGARRTVAAKRSFEDRTPSGRRNPKGVKQVACGLLTMEQCLRKASGESRENLV